MVNMWKRSSRFCGYSMLFVLERTLSQMRLWSFTDSMYGL